MTCFIPRNPFHYKPFTYAYVNFKNEEDKEIAMKKKFSIKQGKIDKPLFISDPTIKRNICNNCGNPDHLYAGCNIKKRTNKRNNTVKAAWKERTKLTAQNKNRSYAQVVKSNATPTNPLNRNNASNQNKNHPKGKNPAHNNNKHATTHSPNNKKEQDERLKNITASGILHSSVARSPNPLTSSPKNDKNEQNKRVRKDPAYDNSSSSEEEQIENMLHTQRTLVQKVDQATSGLQRMIEGALQNFLGFATSSTTEQQFISLEDNEEYLPTDNEEEEADVKNVMEYMTTNNIDILGLAETNVNKNTLRILEHTVQDKFKLYFTTKEKKGTGIRFLVKKEFAIYVQQFQHFEGRIGFIDFYTKNKKIRIVQAYINVQDKEKPQVKRLYKQIEHWTNQCLDSFVKDIIIMGDFNTKWNEYELLDASHWRHDIFNYFKKHFIKESTSVFCDDISDMYTYIPNNPNHAHNKIDYIWCNIDLMLSTMDSKPQDVQPVIKTDHRMITLDLFIDDIIINKNNTQKRQTLPKTIYCYDEMQKTDGEWNWDKFNKDISEYLDDPNIKLTTNKIRGINSQKQTRRAKLDFNDRSIENRQKIITHITALHRRSNGIRSSSLSDFISITKRHNISISNRFLRDKTFQYKDILQNTIIILESKYINATYEYKKNMMDTFIQERNQNYKTDKKKMIKSVLERPHTSLSIDKVYKNDNNEDILYTEENKVKEQTNLHFQTIAGAINCEKDLSQHPEWQDQHQEIL
ncbi:hypothetical protein RclHR1_12440002 [Rhizophagus clarus]|uniref:Endonuclease/exonuclease/phosphatase domain-containing protein n=1 Tax=Rhizophagus clarus TaxID=94130 RepID=A0A2Z6QJM3_9GLOM|nr:hypothetical protein RclHR1_12440002 [Rhizophagus clarus]